MSSIQAASAFPFWMLGEPIATAPNLANMEVGQQLRSRHLEREAARASTGAFFSFEPLDDHPSAVCRQSPSVRRSRPFGERDRTRCSLGRALFWSSRSYPAREFEAT